MLAVAKVEAVAPHKETGSQWPAKEGANSNGFEGVEGFGLFSQWLGLVDGGGLVHGVWGGCGVLRIFRLLIIFVFDGFFQLYTKLTLSVDEPVINLSKKLIANSHQFIT